MTLSNRLRHLERHHATGAQQFHLAQFQLRGEWPQHRAARLHVLALVLATDEARLSFPSLPWKGREVRRRHRERRTILQRAAEDGTPCPLDSLPPLFPDESEVAALEAEVRDCILRYRASGELPDDDELKRDVLETLDMEARTSGRSEPPLQDRASGNSEPHDPATRCTHGRPGPAS